MKGKMKKLVALALATIMVLAMGITAFAVESDSVETPPTGTISVKGANAGKYYAYKVFDGTASKDGSMSYTVSGKALTYMLSQADKDGVITSNGTKLFTLVSNGGATYVKVENADAAAAWVQEHYKDLLTIRFEIDEDGAAVYTGADAEASTNSVTKTAILEGLEYGYYYVITGTEVGGSAVMLTSVNGDVDINEKHGTPGFTEDPDDGKHVEGEKTYQIGETIKYTIQFSNALNYVNGELITNYTVRDNLATGIELIPESVHVYVDNAVTTGNTKGEVGLLSTEANVDKIAGEITWVKEVENADGTTHLEPIYADAPSVITIEYEVLVTKDFVAGDTGVTNTVEIGYVTEDGNVPENPPTDKETVYTGEIEITKVDNDIHKMIEDAIEAGNVNENGEALDEDGNVISEQYLAGAEFVIAHTVKDEDGKDVKEYVKTTVVEEKVVGEDGEVETDEEGNEITVKKVSKVEWTRNIDEATRLITDEKGKAKVEGLKAGTYELIEVEAPEGYNLMAESKTFILSVTEETDEDGKVISTTVDMSAAEMIPNSTGTLLPSTGGIGTTIFYVVGGILVVAAGVLLITKKRMSKHN